MRNQNHGSATSTWARGTVLGTVLVLAIQPCMGCLAGSGEAHAAPSHASAPAPDDCGGAAGLRSGLDGDRAPESAPDCASLSERWHKAYVPTAAVPLAPVPAAPGAPAVPAPSFVDRSGARDGLRCDPVPLFLRHTSFRI